MLIKFFSVLMFLGSITLAQNILGRNTEIIQYRGNIGKYNITMLLTHYDNKLISGYYYYNNVGQLIVIESIKDSKGIKLKAEPLEKYGEMSNGNSIEIIEFPDTTLKDKNFLVGKWSYKKKIENITLTKENFIYDWRFFEYSSEGNNELLDYDPCKNYFLTFYPSIKSSPVLNKYFLQLSFLNDQIVDFINSRQNKYLKIGEYLGEDTTKGYWEEENIIELVYISNSFLTYKYETTTISGRSIYGEFYTSININNGEKFDIANVFKKELIDTVINLVRYKCKHQFLQQKPGYQFDDITLNDITDYFDDVGLFLVKSGLYFQSRDYRNYIVFLSYKQIWKYLQDSFISVIEQQ